AKFPVNFPVSREFGVETSSQLTASSATQSGLCGAFIPFMGFASSTEYPSCATARTQRNTDTTQTVATLRRISGTIRPSLNDKKTPSEPRFIDLTRDGRCRASNVLCPAQCTLLGLSPGAQRGPAIEFPC